MWPLFTPMMIPSLLPRERKKARVNQLTVESLACPAIPGNTCEQVTREGAEIDRWGFEKKVIDNAYRNPLL